MEYEGDGDTNSDLSTRYIHQMIGIVTGGLGSKRTCRNHSNYCIIEIGQNTEKRPSDLRRRTVTQTPVKNHMPTLERKANIYVDTIEPEKCQKKIKKYTSDERGN